MNETLSTEAVYRLCTDIVRECNRKNKKMAVMTAVCFGVAVAAVTTSVVFLLLLH